MLRVCNPPCFASLAQLLVASASLRLCVETSRLAVAVRAPVTQNAASRAANRKLFRMTTKKLTLDDLMGMKSKALRGVMDAGHPLDEDVLADSQYLGVDLSLPGFMRKILWHTFRKCFHRDPATGVLRGWNVKMEQNGIDGPAVPLTDRKDRQVTFGHYHVKSAEGVKFPKRWTGPNFLDYTVGGNKFFDMAKLGYTPLIAVNEGSSELLLGWEIFKVGPLFLPLPLFWALRRQGPLKVVVPVPKPNSPPRPQLTA